MRNSRLLEQPLFPAKSFDDYRIGLVYPAGYSLGMSNLGFQWALYRAGLEPGFAAERFFLEPGNSLPRSRESGRPANDFHLLGFSISFELDYPGVISFLQRSSIPPAAARRGRQYPLLVAGGAALQVNPEPLAAVFDIIVAGEGEELWPHLLSAYHRAAGRDTLLDRLAGEPGFYVPSRLPVADAIRRGRQTPAGGEPPPEPGGLPPGPVRVPTWPEEKFQRSIPPFSNIISNQAEFPGTLLVEAARGCPMGCRYCWAGYRYLPRRSFPAGQILALAERARPLAKKVGLVSTAIAQHPELPQLLGELRRMGYQTGLSSLRLSDLQPELLQLLAEGGEAGVTLAPETGGDELRRTLNKSFTNGEIMEKCRLVFASGLQNLKLYFMVGLPGETDRDVRSIGKLVRMVMAVLSEYQPRWKKPGRITVGIGPFVPKPHTPFQFAPMAPPRDLKQKIRHLQEDLSALDQVDVHAGSVREAQLQYILTTGGRDIGQLLLETAGSPAWPGNFITQAQPLLYDRERAGEGQGPPWSILDWGLDPRFLRQEWERSRQGILTPPCPASPGCHRCGICHPAGGGPLAG